MQYVVTSEQMKLFDKNTMEYFGMPSGVLMERAALSVVEELKLRDCDLSHTLVVCGVGNNGGDGFAVARLLMLEGYDVTVHMVGDKAHMTEQTSLQSEIFEKYQETIKPIEKEESYTVVVDALFGIGLSRDIEGNYADAIKKMNHLVAYKVAIDMPSGISADTGKVLGTAFRANLTVTFAFEKIGQLLYPGKEYCGNVAVKNIGIDDYSRLNVIPETFRYDCSDLCKIPKRMQYSNKGSYGKILCIAGSKNMAGAACFSAKAAYETGAGLVRVYTAEENRVIIQSLVPEAVLNTYLELESESDMKKALKGSDVICLGPGIGTDVKAQMRVKYVMKNGKSPLILDADALTIIAEHEECFDKYYKAAMIMTPHLGEAARLLHVSVDEIKEDLFLSAKRISEKYGCICVLKDAVTICECLDGRTFMNTSGNSGMSTGGSGDVLTGIICGLISQKMTPNQAAVMGIYLHGCAGDAARKRCGEYSMTARDILDGIRLVLKEI